MSRSSGSPFSSKTSRKNSPQVGLFRVALGVAIFGVTAHSGAQQAATTGSNAPAAQSATPSTASQDPQLTTRSTTGGTTQNSDQNSEPDPRKRQLSDKEKFRQQKEVREELKGPYKKWVNEDVHWIITDE
jgi:hypothetical protein